MKEIDLRPVGFGLLTCAGMWGFVELATASGLRTVLAVLPFFVLCAGVAGVAKKFN